MNHSLELLEYVANLPNLPGVYRMLGENACVLYVGKARQLKQRVSSYFQKNHNSPRITLMVAQIVAIETTVTRTEAEALLLENNLIKALNPRYNILFRDDKSYPYIKLTKHEYPQIVSYRGNIDQQSHQFFGPYPNGWAVRETIQLIQRVFLLRTCDDNVFKNRSRPCLLYQIKRCSGPCVSAISFEDYQNDVKTVSQFLRGEHQSVLNDLSRDMEQHAAAWNFEQAAQLRDKIARLNSILHQEQHVDTGDLRDTDVICGMIYQGKLSITLAMIRNGRHLGDRTFFPTHLQQTMSDHETNTDILHESMLAFLSQHYSQYPLPNYFVIDPVLPEDEWQEWLATQDASKIHYITNPQGLRKKWLEDAQKNAQIALRRFFEQNTTQKMWLESLLTAINLPCEESANVRIECWDISHSHGEATQGACVVYQQHQLQTAHYRRYNITDITGGDDYAAMRQALTRHYKQYNENSDATFPDIVLIDGGLGQLNIAIEVFEELGLNIHCLVAVAKGDGRKVGLETLLFADDRPSLELGISHPGLLLVASIRDEAHRFAITGMRAKRSKARKVSQLEEISNIGPKRRQRLLTRFGGLQGVKQASIEELASVEGISLTLAEQIYQQLHKS